MAERHQEITETEEDEAGNRRPDRKKNQIPFFKTKKGGPNRFPVDEQ